MQKRKQRPMLKSKLTRRSPMRRRVSQMQQNPLLKLKRQQPNLRKNKLLLQLRQTQKQIRALPRTKQEIRRELIKKLMVKKPLFKMPRLWLKLMQMPKQRLRTKKRKLKSKRRLTK